MALLTLAAAFGLVACGSSDPTFDRAKAEDDAQELVEDEDLKVDDANCDEPSKVADGENFDCDVDLDGGGSVKVEGEFTNDEGRFRLRPDNDDIEQAQAQADGGTDTGSAGSDTPSGGSATDVPAELESTIRDFQTAVIDNDATGACVELSDAALEREFGGFTECLSKFKSQAPAGSSSGADLVIESANVTGDKATASVRNPGTGVTSSIQLVDEGGTTGWAIDRL